MSHVPKPPKGPCRRVEFRGLGPFFNTMHPYFDYIAGLMLLKRNRQYVDTEDTSLGSFDCSKGNIDTRITGSWDESLPPMTIPRCMATAVTLGLYHTRKELLDYLNLWQKFRGGSNDTPLPTPHCFWRGSGGGGCVRERP